LSFCICEIGWRRFNRSETLRGGRAFRRIRLPSPQKRHDRMFFFMSDDQHRHHPHRPRSTGRRQSHPWRFQQHRAVQKGSIISSQNLAVTRSEIVGVATETVGSRQDMERIQTPQFDPVLWHRSPFRTQLRVCGPDVQESFDHALFKNQSTRRSTLPRQFLTLFLWRKWTLTSLGF
jgi:hypothetical protein